MQSKVNSKTIVLHRYTHAHIDVATFLYFYTHRYALIMEVGFPKMLPLETQLEEFPDVITRFQLTRYLYINKYKRYSF